MSDSLPAATLQALAAIVGSEHVLTDLAERELCSNDVFGWGDAPLTGAVVRPGGPDEVAALLRAAAAQDVAVAVRGGGVSYSQGYVPESTRSITVDLSRLNAIHELNAADLYATVGAACTFEQLDAAARPFGLRPVLRGPISGGVATVGGCASQNTGSSPMSGVTALEVVLPDGSVVRTGSAARAGNSSPFYRSYGPDLTGLFLGDTGTFGIKTTCTLALEKIPAGFACASLGFTSMDDIARVMLDIGRSGIACRQLGMDALKNRTATKVSLAEGLGTLAGVVTGAGRLTTGIRQAAGMALAGRKVLQDVSWSLHLTVEGHDQQSADHALAALQPLWGREARELPPSVPLAMRSRPYSIRGILGVSGERWVPVHGIFPPSAVQQAVAATESFFENHAVRLREHGIDHSYIIVGGRPHWLLEPMFYWLDEISPLHQRVLGSKSQKYFHHAANPAARAVVRELRAELARLFANLGAVHSQLGKFYTFGENLLPGNQALLTAIKNLLDPAHRLSPGNLGWHRQ